VRVLRLRTRGRRTARGVAQSRMTAIDTSESQRTLAKSSNHWLMPRLATTPIVSREPLPEHVDERLRLVLPVGRRGCRAPSPTG
jgi:hypothetical protein